MIDDIYYGYKLKRILERFFALVNCMTLYFKLKRWLVSRAVTL